MVHGTKAQSRGEAAAARPGISSQLLGPVMAAVQDGCPASSTSLRCCWEQAPRQQPLRCLLRPLISVWPPGCRLVRSCSCSTLRRGATIVEVGVEIGLAGI